MQNIGENDMEVRRLTASCNNKSVMKASGDASSFFPNTTPTPGASTSVSILWESPFQANTRKERSFSVVRGRAKMERGRHLPPNIESIHNNQSYEASCNRSDRLPKTPTFEDNVRYIGRKRAASVVSMASIDQRSQK
jgi:hypothetical protein